jgi:hypothetical protein
MPRTPDAELERRDLEQHCAAFITKLPATCACASMCRCARVAFTVDHEGRGLQTSRKSTARCTNHGTRLPKAQHGVLCSVVLRVERVELKRYFVAVALVACTRLR